MNPVSKAVKDKYDFKMAVHMLFEGSPIKFDDKVAYLKEVAEDLEEEEQKQSNQSDF